MNSINGFDQLYIYLTYTYTHMYIYMKDEFEITQLNHEEKAFKSVKRKQKEKKIHKDKNFQRIEEIS